MTKCELCHRHIWEWQSSSVWNDIVDGFGTSLRVKEKYDVKGHIVEYTELMEVHDKCIKKYGKKLL